MTRDAPLLTWPDKRRARRFGGARPARIEPPTERQWHITLARTIRARHLLADGWRMTHFPAGEERDPKTGAILRAMGLEPGWPDLLFARPRNNDLPVGLLHGLELKRLGRGQSDAQIDVGEWFTANGWPYAVVDTIEGAWRVIQDWGALRLRVHT